MLSLRSLGGEMRSGGEILKGREPRERLEGKGGNLQSGRHYCYCFNLPQNAELSEVWV